MMISEILEKLNSYLIIDALEYESIYLNIEPLSYNTLQSELNKELNKSNIQDVVKQKILKALFPVLEISKNISKLHNYKKSNMDIEIYKDKNIKEFECEVNLQVNFKTTSSEIDSIIKENGLLDDDPSVGLYASTNPNEDAFDLIIDDSKKDVNDFLKKLLKNIKYEVNDDTSSLTYKEYSIFSTFSFKIK